jgi:molybdate transport system substrate-binding protein
MRVSILIVVLGLALASCNAQTRQEVLVSAAASLTDVFAQIEVAFEETNPGLDVVLNLGGSSSLREQILAGAPADVFASADVENMLAVVDAGLIAGDPVVFAGNRMHIAVPRGNPAGVSGLASFGEEGLVIGLCAEAVPCGDAARLVLEAAGVVPAVDTNEPNVRALLTKIETGELDAGIVYATDVRVAEVDGIDIPDAVNVRTEYPVAVLSDAANGQGAERFVEFLISAAGREILARYGFET